ncbi:MAG: L-type lectin-domain containing protein [Planctomycetota bacterium]
MVGRAATVGTTLRVHDELAPSGADNRGAVWYATPVAVAAGFDTTFVVNMNQNGGFSGGGDGMAFVIQNEQIAGQTGGIGITGIGRHASALGYGRFTGSAAGESVDNSLVIELDTFRNDNQPAADPILDPDSNHISIHTGGNGENWQQEDFSIGRAPSEAVGVDLNDGVDHTIRVVYVPGTIEVFVDGSLVLTAPYDFQAGGTYVDTGMPAGGLDLMGGTSAWVGFTAASGGLLENHDVVSWTFDSGGPGTNYCMANPNSTGAPALMSSATSLSVAANDTVLMCSSMPNASFAFFLTGPDRGFVTNPGGSAGNLCVGGAIGRYVGPGQIQNSGPAGAVSLALDLSMHPTPNGLIQVQPGETWRFQAWYRDVDAAGQATSNFSDGLELSFTN